MITLSVRKRSWKTTTGEKRTAWLADYTKDGERHHKQFERKRDADLWLSSQKVEIATGLHVPDRDSATVAQAAALWLSSCQGRNLEASTLASYEQHVRDFINPRLGDVRLNALTVPMLVRFEGQLRTLGKSAGTLKKTGVLLSGILGDAVERGLATRNPAKDRRRRATASEKRHKRRLQVGVDIPTPGEVARLLATAAPAWRPLLAFACLTGCRASEIRGLRWVDIEDGYVHIRQRADYRNAIGRPKSASSARAIPLAPQLRALLDARRAEGRPGPYVFGTTTGTVANYSNLRIRVLIPAWAAIGITDRYQGWHALRHFFASWCVNRPPQGLGLSLKETQDRLGHASITLTADIYAHLIPRDDAGELAIGAAALLPG